MRRTLTLVGAALVSGCVTTAPYDYTAFRQSRPRSILIVPPVNDSPAVEASYTVLSEMTLPLAESGYYVLPVALTTETFRQNGLGNPADIERVSITKLHQIFGADAALYTHVKAYGTVYQVLGSNSVVTAESRLVDLRSGSTIWKGQATASSAESRDNSGGGGIIGVLVAAVVRQVMESSMDMSRKISTITSARLLSAGRPDGVLYGPRSPFYDGERMALGAGSAAVQASVSPPLTPVQSAAPLGNVALKVSNDACLRMRTEAMNCAVAGGTSGSYELRVQVSDPAAYSADSAQITELGQTYCREVINGGLSGMVIIEDRQHGLATSRNCSADSWSSWGPVKLVGAGN